jgi:hypothetical protein
VNNRKVGEDQFRIATALRNLQAPDARPAQTEAVRRAEDAAAVLQGAIPDRDPKAAAAQAAEAALALAARLAPQFNPVPADQPEPGAAQAEVTHLIQRQRQVRERLQAIVAGQSGPQHDLRDEAAALGRDLADLRDRARPLSQHGVGPAQEAAQILSEQAPLAMDVGADRLAQGQVAAAREAQRQAAALIERGAQQAEDLAAALRADGTANERGPVSDDAVDNGSQTPARPLATARAAMRRALEQLAQAKGKSGNADAARQAMQQAARSLRMAAERGASGAAGAQATAPGTHVETEQGDPRATLAGAGTPDLSVLQATVARQTGRAWGELPGHLRTEILQMAQGRYRDDYARLIQLYFREIAAGAGRTRP